MSRAPRRIICLSAESADWLFRIGAWESVVGVTAYFNQHDDAPQKGRVSGFSTARLEEIKALRPDLIITFSDVQAELSAELIKCGLSVLATNQRTLHEIEATMRLLGRVVDREQESEQILAEFCLRLTPASHTRVRPRVYFEEWSEPFIAGIAWVSELIERAGGNDVFAELKIKRAAAERVVSSDQICRANPEIIFASWCGRPVDIGAIMSRGGWGTVAAVRSERVHEIAGEDILQPSFNLVNGYERLKKAIRESVS